MNAHRKSSEQGWGSNYGDWLVDTNKFSGGLKPNFDYIKSLGMKPGLWMSVASATEEDSKVFLRATGKELMHTDGIPVQMKKEYEGKIYEIRME